MKRGLLRLSTNSVSHDSARSTLLVDTGSQFNGEVSAAEEWLVDGFRFSEIEGVEMRICQILRNINSLCCTHSLRTDCEDILMVSFNKFSKNTKSQIQPQAYLLYLLYSQTATCRQNQTICREVEINSQSWICNCCAKPWQPLCETMATVVRNHGVNKTSQLCSSRWRAEVWWCPGRLLNWTPPYQILVLRNGVWWSLLLDIRCLWRHIHVCKFVDTCIFRDARAAAQKQWKNWRQWKLTKTKNHNQLCLFLFINNVDLKNDSRNYRKSFWIFCVPE